METGGRERHRWSEERLLLEGLIFMSRILVKVLWFGYLEEVVCDGDDLTCNPLYNFEPMKGLDYWGDVIMFESAGNAMCRSILNMLKALNLSDG